LEGQHSAPSADNASAPIGRGFELEGQHSAPSAGNTAAPSPAAEMRRKTKYLKVGDICGGICHGDFEVWRILLTKSMQRHGKGPVQSKCVTHIFQY
jgi:hypothetical protein